MFEKVHAVVARREAHFEVKIYKTHLSRTTFGSCDVEKVHAIVARSTFRSQNVQSTPCTDNFWTFRSRKSARCWQARSTLCTLSKCLEHHMFAPLLEVLCNISKNDGRRGTFEEDLQRCIFRGRRSTRDIFIGAVRRSVW